VLAIERIVETQFANYMDNRLQKGAQGERPSQSNRRLWLVNFEHDSRQLPSGQCPCRAKDITKVAMYLMTFNKSTLVRGDERMQVGSEAVSYDFGEKFPKAVYKTDRVVIRERERERLG
jgi:hypothetical protein